MGWEAMTSGDVQHTPQMLFTVQDMRINHKPERGVRVVEYSFKLRQPRELAERIKLLVSVFPTCQVRVVRF